MLALKRKTSNAITTMATLVAIVVLIRNCHQRADIEHSEIINEIPNQTQNIGGGGSTYFYDSLYRNNKTQYNWQRQLNKSSSKKPISAKMAYALLQEIKKLNPRQKATILDQFNITEANLKSQLSPIAGEKTSIKISLPANFNPNNFDSSQWIKTLRLQPWKYKFILKYQYKLGGFYTLEQLREIPQLDSAWKVNILEPLLAQQIEKQAFPVKKLDKNSSWKQWYQHPYAGALVAKILKPFYEARKCVNYEDLKAMKEISPQQLKQLLPYLSIDCKD